MAVQGTDSDATIDLRELSVLDMTVSIPLNQETTLADVVVIAFGVLHPLIAGRVAGAVGRGKFGRQLASEMRLYGVKQSWPEEKNEAICAGVLLLAMHLRAHPEEIDQYKLLGEAAGYSEAHQE